MSQNTNTDTTADNMLDVLKGELAMETANQVNEAALIQQKEMEFQENLKKLWFWDSSSIFTYFHIILDSLCYNKN